MHVQAPVVSQLTVSPPTSEENDHCQHVHCGESIHTVHFEAVSKGAQQMMKQEWRPTQNLENDYSQLNKILPVYCLSPIQWKLLKGILAEVKSLQGKQILT